MYTKTLSILFCTDTYLPTQNGVISSIQRFSSSLRQQGHQVTILAPQQKNIPTERNVVTFPSFSLPFYPEIRPGRTLNLTQRSFGAIPLKNYDLVHVHTPGTIGLLGLRYGKWKNIPTIATYHTRLSDYTQKHYGRWIPFAQNIVDWWERFFHQKADHLILPHHSLVPTLTNLGITRPYTILPTGIDLDFFCQPHSLPTQWQSYFSSDQKTIKIGVLTRLAKEKNVVFLLQSLKILQKRTSRFHFLLAGSGPEEKALKKICQQLGLHQVVSFVGAIPPNEVPAFLQHLDIFTYSCLTDTQGLVMLEAAAAGCPLVALHDRIFETLLSDGKNGSLVKEKTPTAFAQALLYWINHQDLRQQARQLSRQKAQYFDQAAITQQLTKLYQEL